MVKGKGRHLKIKQQNFFQNFNNERIFKTISMCVSKTKEKIIEAFERLTLQLDKGYWREKHTSHHDSHQGRSKLRLFKKYLGKV